MKKGLVLEGGGLRSLFSEGVFDVLLENDICFDGAIGVSAGASIGCNMKTKQKYVVCAAFAATLAGHAVASTRTALQFQSGSRQAIHKSLVAVHLG